MLFFLIYLTFVFCEQGVDVSEVRNSTWKFTYVVFVKPCGNWGCMGNYGYNFAIVRCYRSSGSIDPNCANSVNAAWKAGFSHVDVYLFPCPTCGDGAGQVKTLSDYLRNNNVKYGQIWLDIEGTQYWLGSTSKNQAFFQELLTGVQTEGVSAGIYTNYYEWEGVMSLSYTGGSNLPLWYAHYDGSKSFSDYQSFGGWSSPAMKQFQGDQNICGCGVDLNWYPG